MVIIFSQLQPSIKNMQTDNGKMIDISIILPTYNRAYILRDCIELIISQTYKNWELIILDDCSTDNTSEIGLFYQKHDVRIRYIRNEKTLQQQRNKNKGISLAKYQHVFIMEDDVLLDERCLEKLVESYEILLKNKNIGAIAPRLINYGEDQKSNNNPPFIINRITGEIWNNYSVKGENPVETKTLHACSIFAKKVFFDVGGFSEGRYIGNCYREETDLFFKIRHKGYSLYYIPSACAIHKSGTTGGCKIHNLKKWHYYNIRNHSVFLWKFFHLLAIVMIPCYIVQYFYHRLFMIWIKKRKTSTS